MNLIVGLYNLATKRYVPLILVLLSLVLFVALDGYQLFNLKDMQAKGDEINLFIAEHRILAALAYALLYIAFVCISAPGAFIITIIGGFLFGPILGGTLATIAGTFGALLVYEILNCALGKDVNVRLQPFANEIKNGFSDHGFFYMVILRVAPIFPFWVINLVPALLGVRRRVNVLTTFFGIAPACYVYASIGAGSASLLERGHLLTMEKLLSDSAILLPLNGLVILAVLPLILSLLRSSKEQNMHDSSI